MLDPISPEALELYPVVKTFLTGRVPIRMAFLFDRQTENTLIHTPRDGSEDPISDIVVACFHHLKKHQSTQQALEFLTLLSANAVDNEVTLEIVKSLLGETFDEVYSPSHLGASDAYLSSLSEYMEEVGLQGESPAYFFNGVPFVGYPFTVSRIQYTSLIMYF